MSLWDSLTFRSASESWRGIRSFRSEPPEALRPQLADPDRALVFQTALEQAQQQFAAAAAIRYESRALNLYYGLSQAVRAIAAASGALSSEFAGAASSWRVSGHGLTTHTQVPNASEFLTHQVVPKPVKDESRRHDMFSRLSFALGSPQDTGPVSVAELLSQLPEWSGEFGTVAGELPALRSPALFGGPRELMNPPYRIEMPVPGVAEGGDVAEVDLRTALKRYPALRDLDPVDIVGTVNRSHNVGCFWLLVHDSAQLYRDGSDFRLAGTVLYRNLKLLPPATGRSEHSLAPLAIWALVLYTLSMISRYAPDSWTRVLTPASSPVASKIEHALDVALDSVPELIGEALGNLNN